MTTGPAATTPCFDLGFDEPRNEVVPAGLLERMAHHRDRRGGDLRRSVLEAAARNRMRVDHDCPPTETKLSFALLHHGVYEIERACEARDTQRLERAVALATVDASQWVGPHAAESFVAVGHEDCTETIDARFGSTVYTVPDRAPALCDARRDVVSAACTLLRNAGEAVWLAQGLAIAVLAEENPGDGTQGAFSYSLGALPGTVFTDWVQNPVVVAECLLHESVHCWLNAALAAERERLPGEPRGYSPWKDCERPPFGLLHAGMAFSRIAAFLSYVATRDDIDEPSRRYAEIRSDVERRRLRLAAPSLRAALAVVRSHDVRAVVEWSLAMSPTGRSVDSKGGETT